MTMNKKTVSTAAESKTKQIKAFAANHKGEEFTATGLARALGWTKRKVKMIKGEDGKMVEDTVKISQNAKAAIRLAKKCGAKLTRTIPPQTGKNPSAPVFSIVL
jgi:hypothetical protein